MNVRKILLVEDNADDVALTMRAFEKSKIVNQIDVVRDGEEAVEYLMRTGRYANRKDILPSVVLLDLKLPKISGLEVLRTIRENEATRLLPVVILTTSREECDLVRGYSLGANSYVCKPVDFSQFVDAVRQLGLYWIVLNERPPID